jgi:hypothetical protein
MESIAEVIKIDENIEEEVVVEIKHVQFTGFIANAPYPINVGSKYIVEISLYYDEVEVKESIMREKSLVQKNDTFCYIINGFLNESGQLDIGFLIEDELFEDYQYLYGKYITLTVDRLNLDFLTKAINI